MESLSPNPLLPIDSEPPAAETGFLMAPAPGSLEADQERDIWWGAYAGRAMLPSFLLCILLTVLLSGLAVFLGVSEGRPSMPFRYAAYTLIGAIWCFQSFCWAYRMGVWTYRLTTHRLFREWTFWRTPNEAIEVRLITQLIVERTAWDRWTGVGQLRIVSMDRIWVLQGICQPECVAATIWGVKDRFKQTSAK